MSSQPAETPNTSSHGQKFDEHDLQSSFAATLEPPTPEQEKTLVVVQPSSKTQKQKRNKTAVVIGEPPATLLPADPPTACDLSTFSNSLKNKNERAGESLKNPSRLYIIQFLLSCLRSALTATPARPLARPLHTAALTKTCTRMETKARRGSGDTETLHAIHTAVGSENVAD